MSKIDLENGMLLYREEEPEEYCRCAWCGGVIYEGDEYYDFDGESVCEECIKGALKKAI